ncbi:MAG: ATP-binding cassette domain-containing protein [Candidatus Gracilibacteria bacterium]|nr:ATP-binding cassette domain-containing protein [Candidatus Gracilibacteria bacterium]
MLESEVKIIEEEKSIIEKLSEVGFTELENIVNSVLEKHGDFNYYEIQEVCEDFLSEIPLKIKEVTKLKRLKKYVIAEFELNSGDISETEKVEKIKQYSLQNIPQYLFSGKSKINSNLINIENLVKNIGLTNLFEGANFKINKGEKIALIGKNGSGKTTLLKIILAKLEKNLEKFGLENLEGTGTITIAPNLKIGYLSQDLFWKSEKNTLRQEMLQIFPEITKK